MTQTVAARERADSYSQVARRAGPLRDGAACLAAGDAPADVPPLDGQGRVRTLSPRDGHPFHLAHREMDVLPLFSALRDLFVPFRDRPRSLLAQNHKRPAGGWNPPTSQGVTMNLSGALDNQ